MPDATPAAYASPTEVRRLKIFDLKDLEAEAEKVLPPGGFNYIAGGAGDEWTKAENEAAFQRIQILPTVLTGHKDVDCTTTLLGTRLSMPVIVAPMGGHGLGHASRERGTAIGTHAAGTLLTAPMMSTQTLEEIAEATPGPKWWQMYFPADSGLARELIGRVKAAGYSAIMVTCDSFAAANRERDLRAGFQSPLPRGNIPGGRGVGKQLHKKDLGWDDIAFVQRQSGLPVLLKGVLSPKLAKAAVERGIAGIQVSNHGGRQLDGTPASITMLPRIAEAVGARVPLLLDGGVRRGQDVFRALALGAAAVAVARPVMYGLALGGHLGVESVLEHLKGELRMVMTLAGTAKVSQISREFLA